MSPVLKKRHSKSCVPLFSKNQGFALLHIPFLSHFLQSKKQLPFRNCFPVYSLFYFQKPFPLAFSFISAKMIPPQIASDEILHTTPHHPSQVQNVEKNKSYATFSLRHPFHKPQSQSKPYHFALPVRKALFFGQFLSAYHFLRNHRWKYPSLVPVKWCST